MKIVYSKQAKEHLLNIKAYIYRDNKRVAIEHLTKIKSKIEILSSYPYIGKVNTTMNLKRIRDFVVFGYKVIYKINAESITVLAIYKNIDFRL
ncbi:MAG: type II toxin-antitoxin system RelE/ParE family toxin [Thiotrichales bacterium]|jgi:addiction module RelE/StbE family toxin|nr:type II toxin-antitoxin system RelE/ParE family toxin [Thiotrichales bacterium]MBT7005876.1 type II toxin-antitoxin system RelE/ParE family toxin [Thiotrichales bacterium]MBT7314492.1 type II toxin-antitoxin system RelE/ParE family toxin [Thiotrichales bacterium]